MADFKDSGHRPHAIHTGEVPKNIIKDAPYHLAVTLDAWGPEKNLFTSMYDALQANWGEHPSETVGRITFDHPNNPLGTDPIEADWAYQTGWNQLTNGERAYVESCFAGQTLQQVLERITFSFVFDGVTRACTHQLVRSRIGAGFMQHGGRDNDWRHRAWVMPETIRRAIDAVYSGLATPEEADHLDGKRHCITNWDSIHKHLEQYDPNQDEPGTFDLEAAITTYLQQGRDLYAALVDAGIPWQDARRLLWMGTSTYLHADYTYPALAGVIGKRGEHIMDWEINCVAQLMMREVNMKCPPLIGKYLMPLSDKLKRGAFDGLESWTPDGKYGTSTEAKKLPRLHRPEQNPFWILSPAAMKGGPIEWIATNGLWPEELK